MFTVKDILAVMMHNAPVRIYQKPIAAFRHDSLVLRGEGLAHDAIRSGQNYLHFVVDSVDIHDGIADIVCVANKNQERDIVKAFYSGR